MWSESEHWTLRTPWKNLDDPQIFHFPTYIFFGADWSLIYRELHHKVGFLQPKYLLQLLKSPISSNEHVIALATWAAENGSARPAAGVGSVESRHPRVGQCLEFCRFGEVLLTLRWHCFLFFLVCKCSFDFFCVGWRFMMFVFILVSFGRWEGVVFLVGLSNFRNSFFHVFCDALGLRLLWCFVGGLGGHFCNSHKVTRLQEFVRVFGTNLGTKEMGPSF